MVRHAKVNFGFLIEWAAQLHYGCLSMTVIHSFANLCKGKQIVLAKGNHQPLPSKAKWLFQYQGGLHYMDHILAFALSVSRQPLPFSDMQQATPPKTCILTACMCTPTLLVHTYAMLGALQCL